MRNHPMRASIMEILNSGRMVRVVLCPDARGVVVPERFRREETLALDFGRRAPTPIHDLECGLDALAGTLRFGDCYHWCSVPWDAIVGFLAFGESVRGKNVQRWKPTVIDGGKN